MNPKCLGGPIPDTFRAKSPHLMGLKMRRITRAASFDHLVGEQLQRVGHLDAEQSRRLRVDDKLEFARLQDRQFGWLCTFEDLPRVDADLTRPALTFSPWKLPPSGWGCCTT